MDKKDNPLKVIEVSRNDHREPQPPGPIDYKNFVQVTPKLRQQLQKETLEVLRYFAESFRRLPNVPAVAKVTLREDALAKSHRPKHIFTTRTCPIIGSLELGEILVSATPSGLKALHQRIGTTQGKAATANISAIEKIEAYTEDDIAQRNAADNVPSTVPLDQEFKLKIFDHHNQSKNQYILEALGTISDELNLELSSVRYTPELTIYKTTPGTSENLKRIQSFVGMQSVTPMPSYHPCDFHLQTSPVGVANEEFFPPPNTDQEYPVVGVIDSGICPNNTLLAPWVVGQESYVPDNEQDNSHGTMVAGLIANGKSVNHGDDRFPSAQAKVLDVPVFSKQDPLSEDRLIDILEDVVPKYPNVKVWNLSLGGSTPVHTSHYSDFARFIDDMHDRYGCLFVIAAGNHGHLQEWPHQTDANGLNRISSPADSVRALTVGAIANNHTNTSLSKTEEPSPFSRRGPGPCFIPKPEVVQYGGNCSSKMTYAQTGILSLGPNNALFESLGTSFATPLVSAQAAVLWDTLDTEENPSTPERIKALLIHSALLHSPQVTKDTINHFGFGQTRDIIDSIYCDHNSITMMFETDLRDGGYEFERWPFPIPDCLRTKDGKFQGDILMTLVYSPVIDDRFSSEYCRTNVEVGMGSYEPDADNIRRFNGAVPSAPKKLNKMYEKALIESGFKWSPVKAYAAHFQGRMIDTWRLKMKVTRRAELQRLDVPQRATLLLTMRALAPETPVYNEAVQKIDQAGWIAVDIDQHLRIKVRG